MSVLALSCSRFFARFSGTSIRKDCLDRLPNDVLIDGVMSYLDILDILRLRRVSWLYYQLTHHAAVWKRLLRSANIPLPPLPPTARHTPAQMTGLEVERLLCRAYSLDLNWRRRSPRCILEWQLNAYHRVLEMVLLPGGRYLVASVTDPSEEQYSLVVYTVDPPALSKPIAKTGTEMKAYALRAKFVTIKGQKSLAIAYIRRTYHHKTDRLNCAKGFLPNVSQYSTYHEIDMEFRYECVAIHARLSALETLTDLSNNLSTAKFVEEASRLPPPFEHLVCIRSGPAHRLLCPDIEEIFDSAYLAVAKWPNDIILKRLDGGPAVTLTCMQAPVYAQAPHKIKAIRLLPHDNNVFVVREVDVPHTVSQRCPVYLFETHNLTPAGPEKITTIQAAESSRQIRCLGFLTHVQIADPNIQPRDDHSLLGTLRKQNPDSGPPPPICVFGHRTNDEGIVHITFPPTRTVVELPPTPPSAGAIQRRALRPSPTKVVYRYRLHKCDYYIMDAPVNCNVRILSALRRPLLCLLPCDDITDAPFIQSVRPLIDRSLLQGSTLDDVGGPNEDPQLGYFANGPRYVGKHVPSFAWDETIGRLVMAEAGTDTLRVYEFAHTPQQDKNGQRVPIPIQDIPNTDAVQEAGDTEV